ncbi:hypothetical protein JFPO14_contig00010-0092 [Edwardsiella piscicida]|nr:hypothetical protein JFPO13_contig00008-0094 [Edwardsiella piscicida]GBK58330.1 hypothetical protein JFPO14_contig00010-0092 [Edwardsiella piscicida]
MRCAGLVFRSLGDARDGRSLLALNPNPNPNPCALHPCSGGGHRCLNEKRDTLGYPSCMQAA